MKTSTPFAISLLLSAILLAVNTQAENAQASNPSVKLELAGGVEQDSNLNIAELDKNSHESDIAATLNAKVDAQWQPVEKLHLSGGYAYSSKLYQHNDNFNLAINHVSADANYDFDLITAGASYNLANAQLDNKAFLDLRQTSLYASKLVDERIYLRAAANVQEKTFANMAMRNASNTGLSADAFIFFNAGKTFAALGIANENENANAAQFDFTGLSIKGKLSHQFELWDKKTKLQLGWRYFERDYSSITPELKAKRYDSGHSTDAEWEVNLTSQLAAVGKIEYAQYNSNLASADYAETRTSITLKAQF